MKNILLLIIFFIALKLNAQKQGTLDTDFGKNGVTLSITNGSSNAIALQHTGKIVVCGTGIVNKTDGLKLVRYTSDGFIDSSFGINGYTILDSKFYGDGEFFSLAILNDDKIVAAGDLNTNILVARFTADGKLDSSFGANGITENNLERYESIFAMAIQEDEKIVIAGEHGSNLYEQTAIVLRYLPSGELDKDFGDSGQAELKEAIGIGSLAIQMDGKIVAGGLPNVSDDEFFVARLNEDGSYDKSFAGKGYVYTRFVEDHRDNLNSLAIQDDGKIVAAGVSDLYYGWDIGVARYNPDGSLDNSFGKNGLQTISVPDKAAQANNILIQKDQKIILTGGVFTYEPLSGDIIIARLNLNGSIDSSFGESGISITDLSGGGDGISSAALQSDGKIITVGESDFNNKYYDNIARFNNDGSKKQIIITKIKKWLQHHNGFIWSANNNISSYVVQRSYDGVHFSSIARINSNNQSALNYEDASPLSGTNYYRLQTTSINGVVNYSNVIAVTNADIKVSPNPATNVLQIQGLSSIQKTKLTVVDFSGNTKLQTIANTSSFNLNIAALQKGNYILKIETGDDVIAKTFIKQ